MDKTYFVGAAFMALCVIHHTLPPAAALIYASVCWILLLMLAKLEGK